MAMQNSRSQESRAALILVGGEAQKHFELTSTDVCRIGRTPENTIQLAGDNVSRNHAIVQSGDAATFLISDLGSRNGTYVNGSRITSSTPLCNGDIITICGTKLRFVQANVYRKFQETPLTLGATIVERPVNEITVAVVDIRGYTKFCREIGEVRVAEIIHTFNIEAGTVLRSLNAWGVKYIGDAVMAIWVNHGPAREFLLTALRAISALMDIAASLQDRFQLDAPVLLAAAVNVGPASIGNMGSSAAPDYTALGDVVNKVFRLEDCAGNLQADLVISSQAYKALQREIDPERSMVPRDVQLKGYSDSELVYTLDKNALRRILENPAART
jgi:adenylate cyclase